MESRQATGAQWASSLVTHWEVAWELEFVAAQSGQQGAAPGGTSVPVWGFLSVAAVPSDFTIEKPTNVERCIMIHFTPGSLQLDYEEDFLVDLGGGQWG